MKARFEKKKVLFIAPRFYNYEKRIADKISSLNFIVSYFPDFSDDKIYAFFKAIHFSFLLKFYVNYRLNNRVNDIINSQKYDIVFTIKGKGIPITFWEKLKRESKSSDCKFLMYQWDSLKNYNYLHMLDFFDRVYTFDSEDADFLKHKHNKSKYLALFYEEDRTKKIKQEVLLYDFAFIGGGTFYRNKWIERVKLNKKINEYNIYIYLYLPVLTYLYNLLKGKYFNLNYLRFKSISLEQILKVYQESKVIIDLSNQDQSGLTIRTIEALGSRRKLITTNKNIAKEPFYSINNILIIDAEDDSWINTIDSFINAPYLDCHIENYSLTSWVELIFKV